MSVKRKSISVTLDNKTVLEHTLLTYGNSRKLLVILPGRGYFCSHPVLHYLGKMANLNGYDVLQVNYAFQVIPGITVANSQLAEEVQLALDAVLTHPYDRLCIAGKSLGSPLAAAAIHQQQIKEKSLILLTPIANAVDLIGNVHALAIIGTADEAYDASKINDHENLKWAVYEGLNHGLEYANDWAKSTEILAQIIKECELFLK